MKISADKKLPLGNAKNIRVRGNRIYFAAQKHGSPKSMWFGFQIIGAKNRRVTCVWEQTNEMLGHNLLKAAVPVYRSANQQTFKRVPVSKCRYQQEEF